MANSFNAQRAAQINSEFPKFYSFYWSSVTALKNYGQITGKNYLLQFPTITLNGRAWMPNDSLTVQQKDEIMDTIVSFQSQMKQVVKIALKDIEPFQEKLSALLDKYKD